MRKFFFYCFAGEFSFVFLDQLKRNQNVKNLLKTLLKERNAVKCDFLNLSEPEAETKHVFLFLA